MVIYPIAEQLEQLFESFTDPETGELIASEKEMQTAESNSAIGQESLFEVD